MRTQTPCESSYGKREYGKEWENDAPKFLRVVICNVGVGKLNYVFYEVPREILIATVRTVREFRDICYKEVIQH